MAGQLQIRGSALWARREWLRETHGDDGLASLLERVGAAGRNLLRDDIDRRGWYNYPLFIEMATETDALFGEGDGRLNIEVARWSAHRNTPALYEMFIRFGSVDWILQRASKLWREHFSGGAFVVHTERATHFAEGEVVDFPYPHLCHTYSVLGFAIGCVEMSGAADVSGEVVSCRSHGADRTLIRVRWDQTSLTKPG